MSALIKTSELVAGWQQPATRPMSFALQPGEVVGLTGPNGVGKSTLLAALAGRAQVFSGQLTVAASLRLALQTQEVPPVDGLPLSGRELLALTGATADGLPPWLSDRLNVRLDRLSGGQRHFLALWAILYSPADVVLLDEPTNNLDVAGVSYLAEHLRDRAAGGVGLIVVSHDADFVAQACDRVIAMEAPHVR